MRMCGQVPNTLLCNLMYDQVPENLMSCDHVTQVGYSGDQAYLFPLLCIFKGDQFQSRT
jgi:hypothetical protein